MPGEMSWQHPGTTSIAWLEITGRETSVIHGSTANGFSGILRHSGKSDYWRWVTGSPPACIACAVQASQEALQ
jgi:hypothetical protein